MKFISTHPIQNRLHAYLLLWGTQALSGLGSAMTAYALILWSYRQGGSALSTALLSVCSYAPYVLMSIFAGALMNRWNHKRVMLACDAFAALTTVAVLLLFKTDRLELWHLYALNALNGLMNTLQQPAAEVATTLMLPKEHYHRMSGLQTLSYSLTTIFTPVAATALMAFAGLESVLWADLATFAVAFVALGAFIAVPRLEAGEKKEPILRAAGDGLRYLQNHRGILHIILFLAGINLIASVYNAALPAMMLSRAGAGDRALGLEKTCSGLAYLAGSIYMSLSKPPKNRQRVIYITLLISMCTENLLLALGRSVPVWCVGAVLGWLPIPIMNANLNVLMRESVPAEMQGRVYAARNTLQFFTIPVGYLLGGMLVDQVFEPWMAAQSANGFWVRLLGAGKGSGAALLFLLLACCGATLCLCAARVEPFKGALRKSPQKNEATPNA